MANSKKKSVSQDDSKKEIPVLKSSKSKKTVNQVEVDVQSEDKKKQSKTLPQNRMQNLLQRKKKKNYQKQNPLR